MMRIPIGMAEKRRREKMNLVEKMKEINPIIVVFLGEKKVEREKD